jgi:phage terminase small subunit
MKNKLTAKQKIFIDEYLISLNATESAIKAGYSIKTADVIANQNLGKLNIQKAIQSRMEKKENKRIAKQDEVLEYLTRVIRGGCWSYRRRV